MIEEIININNGKWYDKYKFSLYAYDYLICKININICRKYMKNTKKLALPDP